MVRHAVCLAAVLVVWCFSTCARADNAVASALTDADVEALVKVARDVLAGRVRRIDDIPAGVVTPALVKRYRDEVSLTLFADRAPLTRYTFRGKNLIDCAYGMMTRARLMPGHRFYGFDRPDDVGFFVELVSARERIKAGDWKDRLSLLDLGVEGLEVIDTRKVMVYPRGAPDPKKRPRERKQTRSGTLMPARAVVAELDSRDRFIFKLCETLKLFPSRRAVMPAGTYLWNKKTTKVHLLRTRSFLVLPGQSRAQELFRVNTRPSPPPTDSLVAMARRAADHLCRRQKPDGRFFLSLRASTGEESGSYNMISHGLAVEALLDLYERTREARYLNAAGRGVGFALAQTKVEKTGRVTRRFVVFNEQAELGCTALTISNLLRLSKLSGKTRLGKHRVGKTATDLAQFIMDMQYDDGSFRYVYRYDPRVPFAYSSRPAHADMATRALFVLAPHARSTAYRDRAVLGAGFLVGKREAHMNWPVPPAFTWLAVTLRELSETDSGVPPERFAQYLYRMADHVVAEQYRPESGHGPDVTGAYAAGAPNLVTATACKMVVVAEAARLARRTKDKRAEGYLKSLKLAAAFLNVNRFRPENSFYLPDPDDVAGLFRAGLFRSTTRLDTNAFAIQACLKMERLLKEGSK